MKSNVLLLSAGRRVELVESFKKDLIQYFPEAKIFSTDINVKLSAACQISDHSFTVPRVTAPNYIDNILKICSENNIGLVIPTIDTELLLLASHKEKFTDIGVNLIVSEFDFISFCRDKRKTAELFQKLNIDQPAIFDKNDLKFPCFCKPFDGSCSKGAHAILSEDDLTQDLLHDSKNMFMEFVPDNFCEYTIDAYFTDSGVLKCLTPRKRLEVRSGEVSKGVTRKNFVYDYLLERISKLQGARGCITFQLFVDEENLQIKGLEINPRFGGGFPLAYASGATFPKWLIQEYLLGIKLDFYDGWVDGLVMLRYDAKVLVHED